MSPLHRKVTPSITCTRVDVSAHLFVPSRLAFVFGHWLRLVIDCVLLSSTSLVDFRDQAKVFSTTANVKLGIDSKAMLEKEGRKKTRNETNGVFPRKKCSMEDFD